jgi:hypothetical protein
MRPTNVLVLIVLTATTAASLGAEPRIDPQAVEVLQRASDLIRSARTFRVSMETSGRNQRSVHDVWYVSPRRYALILKEKSWQQSGGNVWTGTAISDGSKLTLHVPDLNEYTVTDRPNRWEMAWKFAVQGSAPALAQTVAELWTKGYEGITDPILSLEYAGVEHVEQAECHHLKLQQKTKYGELLHELWLETGTTPLLRKVQHRYGTMIFRDWELDAKPADRQFVFTPPEGSMRVDLLPGMRVVDDPMELIGRPAPEITFTMLDGEQASLADHRGKDVVVVDFWATWCGPCVVALPALEEISQKYRDRGVAYTRSTRRNSSRRGHRSSSSRRASRSRCPLTATCGSAGALACRGSRRPSSSTATGSFALSTAATGPVMRRNCGRRSIRCSRRGVHENPGERRPQRVSAAAGDQRVDPGPAIAAGPVGDAVQIRIVRQDGIEPL